MSQEQAVSNHAPLPGIPGISVVTGNDGITPQFLVIAREKEGKSATVGTSLVNWPRQGLHPLFFAFDESGPNSCLKLGYQPHVLAPKRLPGATIWEKTREALSRLESNTAALKASYGSLIVDCGSTMVDQFHEDARRTSQNPDPRSHFGAALMQAKETMHRLGQLGLPVWWLSWLREPEVVEENGPGGKKVRRQIPGGPNIVGAFKTMLAGRVQHIFILEKLNVGKGQPGADEDGYARLFHTREWAGIRGGGRYSHLLPEPMPAHAGMVMQAVLPNAR